MKKTTPKTSKPARSVTGKSASSDSPMNVDLLQQIVSMMSAHDLNTIDLRDGEKRIVLSRGQQVSAAPQMVSYAPPPPQASLSPASAASSSAPAPAQANDDANLIPIKSPMVGTFYAKASPEAKPFVSVGSKVDNDTDVCIIEAMKVFNSIKAECRGTIEKIVVEDRAAVEFGQVLFLVKP